MTATLRASNAAAAPSNTPPPPCGWLAAQVGEHLPLMVCHSCAGYYLGTLHDGLPFSRESVEYWPTLALAAQALESQCWTQRQAP